MNNKLLMVLILIGVSMCIPSGLNAQEVPGPGPDQELEDNFTVPFIDLSIRQPESNEEVALSVQLLLMLAVLSIAPSFIIIMTSFLRIAIVFDFIRRALSLQQVPPTQVMMAIALFLTIFIMWPTITEIYDNSFKPFSDGEIGIEEAFSRFEGPIRTFMYRQMAASDHKDIMLFMRLSNLDRPQNLSDVPTHVLIPAFILHELTVAFKIGILLFIPFIVIDLVVASTLMSMGMIMLPPIMISLPFKIILFVLVDGWGMITQQMVESFGGF